MAMNSKQFAKFLSDLAMKEGVANAATLDAVVEKLKAEQASRIEMKLIRVFNSIQANVGYLRDCRRNEKSYLAAIKELEAKAEAIANGTDEE